MEFSPEVERKGVFISGVEFNEISNFEGIYRHLHTPALIIGGIFALIALIISLLLIFEHLRTYTNPDVWVFFLGTEVDNMRSIHGPSLCQRIFFLFLESEIFDRM